MKFGGSTLQDPEDINLVANIIRDEPDDKVIVVSALNGVTNEIHGFLSRLEKGKADPKLFAGSLKKKHVTLLTESVMNSTQINKVKGRMNNLLEHWERVAFGSIYTEELTPRSRDFLISIGERLSSIIIERALRDHGIPSIACETDRLGCVTNGEYGSATVNMKATIERLPGAIKQILDRGQVPVITGYFGVDDKGHTTVFGRGGSDYSAAIIANVLEADVLELWKDVDGFLSADPRTIPNARHISKLTYDEAAELAYFGAKILHPMAIWPLSEKDIPLWVGNAKNRDHNSGTWINSKGDKKNTELKSVAHSRNIGILKVHGAGVGYVPGVLSRFVNEITDSGVNIKSVITSQTCISILLEEGDLEKCQNLIQSLPKKVVERVEVRKDVGLIAIVGEGVNKTEGTAGKIFSAIGQEGINVEMISSGASEAAYYFIVKEDELEKAVGVIHRRMFESD